MRRIAVIGSYFVSIFLLSVISQGTTSACQVDQYYLTAGGHLAGVTQDALLKAEKADPKALESMIEGKEVLRLQDDIRVEAIERSVEAKMIKIKLPHHDISVWVREDALKRCRQ